MQTTINKKDFIDALTIGGAMAGKAKSVAILENAKIEVSNNTLIVHSSNLECATRKRVQVVETDEDYTFCINPGELANILKSLIEEEITFEIKNNRIIINHFKGVIEMPIIPSETFPESQVTEDGISVTFNAIMFKEWLTVANSFVSSDDLRPTMCGMYIYSKDGKVGICATDACKLFSDSIYAECDEFGIILPSGSFKPLSAMLTGEQEINATIREKSISFVTANSELHCRLLEGNYPNFRGVIPQQNNIEVKVNKAELLDSVNRASLMANKSTLLLKLTIDDTTMGIEGNDLDFSTKAYESIKIEKSGEDVVIGVKADFFATCFNIINTDNVVMRLGGNSKPILFVDSNNANRILLVMPMRIN